MWWFVHWQSKVIGLDTDPAMALATDEYYVSNLGMASGRTAYGFHAGVWDPLPSDFRGDVTFTATNLRGRTSSCTVAITTFTTRTSWDERGMVVTGGSTATATATQNGSSPVYYANSTYSVAGPKRQLNFTKDKLFENQYGNVSEIVFEVAVTPQAEGLVYIDQQSGDIIISPTSKHLTAANFTAVLSGRDTKGAVAVVNRWSFSVDVRPAFKVLDYDRSGNTTSRVELVTNMTFRAQSPFAAGEAFRIAAINLTQVAHADRTRCTFTLKGNASSAGLYINPATGAIQGLIDKVGLYAMVLVALDEHGAESQLERVVLDVRKKDISVSAYGPGGKGCGDNGQAVDDTGLRFDEAFACSCDNGFEGNNCDVTEVDSGTVVVVFLTSVIAMLCAVYGVKKYQAFKESIAPVDFAAQLQQLVDAGVLPDHLAEQMNDARAPRELPRLWLTLVDRLGAGSFGEVCAQHQSRDHTCPKHPLAT